MNLDYEVLRIRMIEEEISRRYSDGGMRCPIHLSIGQEACAVGVCAALGPSDLMVSTHRSHAHYLAKGGNLNAMVAELHGLRSGCSGGNGGSMHLRDDRVGFIGSTSIVGGTIPIGVGLAFAKKLRGDSGCVVICLGDAAIEEGVFHESANFASLHALPVLFICENNGRSCYTPLNERTRKTNFEEIAEAHHLKYARLSDTDVNNICWLTRKMVNEVPAFLEIQTKRNYEHCGPAMETYPGTLYSEPEWVLRIRAEIKDAFGAGAQEVIKL